MRNVPYSRGLSINGQDVEITKESPYISQGPNRRQRRFKEAREMNNSKGYSMIVTRVGPRSFAKTTKFKNHLGQVCYKTVINGVPTN